MFNLKVGGIAAGAAFALSLVVGLFSRTGFLTLFLRAFIFGGLFFVLTFVVYWLVGQFMPDLLAGQEDDLDIPAPGSRVNISVGSGAIEGAFPTDTSDEVDSIDGRRNPAVSGPSEGTSAGLDLPSDSGYTDATSGSIREQQSGGPGAQAVKTARKAAGAAQSGDDADLMPDFDGLSGAFMPPRQSDDADPVFETPPEPRRPRSGRDDSWGADFNPKELAQGIRTVLQKDEKG